MSTSQVGNDAEMEMAGQLVGPNVPAGRQNITIEWAPVHGLVAIYGEGSPFKVFFVIEGGSNQSQIFLNIDNGPQQKITQGLYTWSANDNILVRFADPTSAMKVVWIYQ